MEGQRTNNLTPSSLNLPVVNRVTLGLKWCPNYKTDCDVVLNAENCSILHPVFGLSSWLFGTFFAKVCLKCIFKNYQEKNNKVFRGKGPLRADRHSKRSTSKNKRRVPSYEEDYNERPGILNGYVIVMV